MVSTCVPLKDRLHLCAINLNFFPPTPFRPNFIHFSPLSHLTCGPNHLLSLKYPCFSGRTRHHRARHHGHTGRAPTAAPTPRTPAHAQAPRCRPPPSTELFFTMSFRSREQARRRAVSPHSPPRQRARRGRTWTAEVETVR
jgi:hypothetical protein